MDDYIERFRNKADIQLAESASPVDIIANSLSRTEVILERLQTAIPVIFINNSKESGDESVVYSYRTDEVRLGDYLIVKDNYYLIYKEIKDFKREEIVDRWNAVSCNVNFTFKGNSIRAYFLGSLRSDSSEEVSIARGFAVLSEGTALLVLPSYYTFKTNESFKIGDEGWRVKYIDKITNPGMTYLTIEQYVIPNKEKQSETESVDYAPTLVVLREGVRTTLNTEDGYFNAVPRVEILERTANYISFRVPYGIETLEIYVKENGVVVQNQYEVRS